jgi:hypothetical protein
MGLSGDAWDVYAVYGPQDTWDLIGSPRVWMHQLDFEPGTRPEDRLDTRRLASEVLSLLRADPAAAADLGASLHRRGVEVSAR